MSDTEVCDHEFDGEECEECGAHVSEYVETLRARIAELEAQLKECDERYCTAADAVAQCCEDNASRAEKAEARVAELEAAYASCREQAIAQTNAAHAEARRFQARVLELEREVKLREAQTQRMMLARDAMQRERDYARAEVAEVARVMNGDHSTPMRAFAYEVSAVVKSHATLLKQRDVALDRAERAEAQVATLRGSEARLHRALTTLWEWQRDCQELPSDALAKAVRDAIAGTAPAPLSERERAEQWLQSGIGEASGTLAFHAAPLSARERAKELIEQAAELVGSYSADRNNESKTLNVAIEKMHAATTLLTEK